MDLLVKWLGAESSVYARRLRAVHIGNPTTGLHAIWERLEEAYGSSEAIENSLMKKLEKFPKIIVHRTQVTSPEDLRGQVKASTKNSDRECPLHRRQHKLGNCRAFRRKPLSERKRLLAEYRACFKCCSTAHNAKTCNSTTRCTECDSEQHVTALHPETVLSHPQSTVITPREHHGDLSSEASAHITSNCTELRGISRSGRSCSKICLVRVYPEAYPDKAVRMYAVLDDQSNKSLARPGFFEHFNIQGCQYPYMLRTCAGVVEAMCRRAEGYVIEGVACDKALPLPSLIECYEIHNNRDEIPTSDVARQHAHLKTLAEVIPPLDPNAQIILLLGRDIVQAHKVREQRNGPNNAPFAQRLDVGWVIVGDVCVDRLRTQGVHAFATAVLENGRPSWFTPCPNHVLVKEIPLLSKTTQCPSFHDDKHDPLFKSTLDGEKFAPSIGEQRFLSLMENGFYKDPSDNWVAPLPFRDPRPYLPDNREQAVSRFASLRRTLQRKPEMKEHFVTFMQDLMQKGHAEPAPPRSESSPCWYLPNFGVYHPRKPNQIRVVFDSSAKYRGVSLNDALLSGSDMTNNLVGVLLPFRKEAVAVTADIQRTFYCFFVREEDRDFLRFFWFREDDINGEVGEDFYVDDGLKSLSSEHEAVDLLERTQRMLMGSNLRLHKIASNSVNVMKAFPTDDYGADLKDLDLNGADVPMQRSLGLSWHLKTDTFTFRAPAQDSPNTRRGGRLFLRDMSVGTTDWDAPLAVNHGWQRWKDSLQALEDLRTPRRRELCAAVLAVEIAELILGEIDTPIDHVRFYSDSKVVLGYIFNEPRRFYVYVSNRVKRIRRTSKPDQWHYVPTDQNPADHATRPVAPSALIRTTWLTGPKFLQRHECMNSEKDFPLFEPEGDPDVRPLVTVSATHIEKQSLGAHRFERFSSWTSVAHHMFRRPST
ncbi:uncharacterized protein LOC135372779 [Ornithodoros turicata]|uniref:uncharacterized protein LOC135372779 n=1 Tax=Ornithodoros turicata TaxID=34597 RepID=UPI00313944C4